MLHLDLNHQQILVTGGGGTGVAAGIVEALAIAGARQIIVDNRSKALERVKASFPEVEVIQLDLTDADRSMEIFADISSDLGPIHGLVNNAGVGLSKAAHQATESEFEHLFALNIQAVWRMSRAFTQQCIHRKIAGNIVNISSVHAHSTAARYAIYSSSKSAIVGLTRGMAVELGPLGIRVNAVAPGYVHAEQNYDLIRTWTDDPEQWVNDFYQNQQVLNFAINPIDVGHTVAFLLSDLSRCITGQNVFVDNGTTSMIFNRDFT